MVMVDVVVTLVSYWWVTDSAGSCGGGDSDEWLMTSQKNLKKSKWPANDSKITGLMWTENQNFFLLSHHFHDWVTGYASTLYMPMSGFNG